MTPAEVPDPGENYEQLVWERLNWRLRQEQKAKPRNEWMKWAAVAASISLAFFLGLFWKRRPTEPEPQRMAHAMPRTEAQPVSAGAPTAQQRDRILLVVVGDHFDRSERVLVELSNLKTNQGDVDISGERRRAEELLQTNSLYRTSAPDRGEESVATLLDDLEPVLLQIANAPSEVSADELRSIQKRVEAKGLVFKLRVIREGVRTTHPNSIQPSV